MMVLLAAGFAVMAAAWAETSREEVFFKANQAYREGRLQEAVDGYLHLIRSGCEGAAVYYNLGNAYLKADRLGYAVWAYERALLLTPRDPDLRFNLSHARDQTRDALGDSGGFVETLFFWLRSFSLQELFWAFAGLNALFWFLLLIRLFKRSEWLYYLLLVAMSLWCVAGLSLGLQYYRIATDERAVILPEEVDILAGPDPADTVLFKLHEGTVVNHERADDGWSLIHVSDKKRGWVKRDALGRIADKALILD